MRAGVNALRTADPDSGAPREPADREARFVDFVVERWLQGAPAGAISPHSDMADRAIGALAEGWQSTVVHALARDPATLPELRHAIGGTGGRELKRCVDGLLRADLITAHVDGCGEVIYAVSSWLRTGVAALIAAARLERRRPCKGAVPIDALDVEAGFLLSLPLLELPRELSGACRLGVNLADDASSPLTGVTVQIAAGRIASCAPGLRRHADAWAAATASEWLDTVIEPGARRIRTGGDRWLAAALLDRLHASLFGVPVG